MTGFNSILWETDRTIVGNNSSLIPLPPKLKKFVLVANIIKRCDQYWADGRWYGMDAYVSYMYLAVQSYTNFETIMTLLHVINKSKSIE